MSVKLDALNTAVAGKAIERGLDAHVADGQVFVYLNGTTEAQDHNHRQVIRNLVEKLVPDGNCHIYTTDVGFRVQVDLPEPQPEVAPNPVEDTDWIEDLSADERLELIRRLVA